MNDVMRVFLQSIAYFGLGVWAIIAIFAYRHILRKMWTSYGPRGRAVIVVAGAVLCFLWPISFVIDTFSPKKRVS